MDSKIVEKFIWSVGSSERNIPFDILLGKHSNSHEPFRKTTILNDLLRKIIDKYSFIIQTDIDMLIPPGLIQKTMNILKSYTCYHCNYRYVEKHEIDTWMDSGYKNIPWTNIEKRKVFYASGSWNGMSNASWKQSNGFCEAIYYLGGPDTEFYQRCSKRGILWFQDCSLPLSHINHPRRNIPKQGKKNMSIARRYKLDYNWLSHRYQDVCPTDIITIGINY